MTEHVVITTEDGRPLRTEDGKLILTEESVGGTDKKDPPDIEATWRAIEAEANPTKRRKLFDDAMARHERERIAALVAIVEDVRARSGDDAAEQTLKALRAFEAKQKKRKR